MRAGFEPRIALGLFAAATLLRAARGALRREDREGLRRRAEDWREDAPALAAAAAAFAEAEAPGPAEAERLWDAIEAGGGRPRQARAALDRIEGEAGWRARKDCGHD